MLYVAYGSNMNLEQMAYRCPRSKIVGNGKLSGWKLVFNFHADVIETGNANDEVPVVIWDIHKNDWHMLDMYEGYPSYYIKREVEVIVEDEKTAKAIVYVMADNNKGISLPAKAYFESIEDGYIKNGIDVRYLYDALEWSCGAQKEVCCRWKEIRMLI